MANSISRRSAGRAFRGLGQALVVLLLALPALLLLAAPASARQTEGEDASLTPQQKAAREIAIAEAAASRVLQLRRHPDFREAASRDGELQSSLDRAQRLLSAAKSGLARAEQRQSQTGFSDTALLARRASRQFDAYEESLKSAFRQIAAERAPPPPPAVEKAPPKEPEPEKAEPPAETPTESATPTPAVAPSPPAAVAAPAVVPPPPSSRRPPKKLRQIADAYFAGDYEQSVALASETRFSQRKPRAHALMLRAAARYALFLLGSESDYALRGQATDDVIACRGADSALVPDEGTFSPRFRDFFAATR